MYPALLSCLRMALPSLIVLALAKAGPQLVDLFRFAPDLRNRSVQHNGELRRRTSSVSDAENAKIPASDHTRLVFKVTPLKSVQTDFK